MRCHTGKVCHCNKKRAAKALRSFQRLPFGDGLGMAVYRCPYGPHWHFGHTAESKRLRYEMGVLRNYTEENVSD